MAKEPIDFNEIYEKCLKDVYYYCLTLTHDRDSAEELTQETFFKGLKNFHKFRGDCKAGVWFCQIAKHTFYTQAKWQKRFVPAESLCEPGCENISPEAQILEKENVRLIHKILHTLPDPYKEVFHLRTFGELPFSQIGEIFEKTENWARVTYYRARRQIQHKWKENHYGDESM